METRRPRRGGKKRFLLPLALLCLAVLLPGALLPPSASASSSSPAAGGGSRKRRWVGFDYYVLALQWPGTICRETSKCCDTNGCCRSKPLKWFTIHGLWPQYNYGGWPSCCRPTKLNINKILMLMPILEQYWPSLYCGSSSTCFGGRGPFWVHEWGMLFLNLLAQTMFCCVLLLPLNCVKESGSETHGTCAYPEIQDEYDYFSTALYLYSKYNVTKALRKARIRPTSGRKYVVGHIVAVIEYAFGAMPSLVCKNGSVQELRLCFHKDYQPRDCTLEAGTAPNSRSYCPRYVTFPSYKPSVMANATQGISNQASKPMASCTRTSDSEQRPGLQVLK